MESGCSVFSTDDLLKEVISVLEAHKANDLVVLDISDKSSLAKSMIIVSGESSRHVKSLAEYSAKIIRPYCKVYIEGMKDGNWVVISFLDIMIHIFRPEVREYYNVEALWSKSRANAGFVAAEYND